MILTLHRIKFYICDLKQSDFYATFYIPARYDLFSHFIAFKLLLIRGFAQAVVLCYAGNPDFGICYF